MSRDLYVTRIPFHSVCRCCEPVQFSWLYLCGLAMLPRAVTRSCRPRFSPTSLVFYVTRQHGQAISTRRRLERQYSASSSTASPSSSNVASASTSDKSTTKTKTKVKESDDLPPLSRPLGVPELPTTYKKTWRDRTLELMDQDVRMERRKHL